MSGQWRRREATVLFAAALVLVAGAVALPTSGLHHTAASTKVTEHGQSAPSMATQVRLPAAALPASSAPLPGISDLMFVSQLVGFVLTAPPPDVGLGGSTIQRTLDGGKSWQTVWQAPDVALESIASAGGVLIATGTRLEPQGDTVTPEAAVMVRTDDNGQSWQVSQPIAPLDTGETVALAGQRLYFADRLHGYAMPDVTTSGSDPPALQTNDGGAHWSTFTLPDGYRPGTGITFANPTDGFVTADRTGAPGAPCEGQVLRTVDGGRSWSPAPGSCAPFPLLTISSPDSTHVFAGGGIPVKFRDGGVARGVLASSDGGLHWQLREQVDGQQAAGPFSSMSFTDPAHGYAITGFCTMGANGPCSGPLLTTADGGTTWTKAGVAGFRLSVPAAGDVLVDSGDGEALQHRTSTSSTFEPVGQPSAYRIGTMLASGPLIYLGTNAGQYLSTDAGRTWTSHPFPGLPLSLVGAAPVALDADGTVIFDGNDEATPTPEGVWVSPDLGRTGSYVHPDLPTNPASGSLLALSGTTILVVEQTGEGAIAAISHDRGATWYRVPAAGLSNVPSYEHLALAGQEALLNGSLLSTDEGRTWQTISTPSIEECQPVGAGDMLGLGCNGTGPALYLLAPHTRTYRALDLITSPPGYVEATSIGDSHHLWAGGGPYLWESHDGGAQWQSVPTPWNPLP